MLSEQTIERIQSAFAETFGRERVLTESDLAAERIARRQAYTPTFDGELSGYVDTDKLGVVHPPAADPVRVPPPLMFFVPASVPVGVPLYPGTPIPVAGPWSP